MMETSSPVRPARLAVAAALLGAWLGAALLFAAVVARAVFAVLPTRALAGAVVGEVLPATLLAGIVAAVAAVLVGHGASPVFRRARATLGLLAAAACAVAQFGIGRRIASLRAEIGPSLDALPMTDPRRVAFGRLHGLSVGTLGVAMLAAGVALVLTIRATSSTRRA